MPRERFDDPTTPGRYAQVNWRHHGDSDLDAPGYVQVSATDKTAEHPAAHLLGWAVSIISNVDAPGSGWPLQTAEWREAARAWLDKFGHPEVNITVNVGPSSGLPTAAVAALRSVVRRDPRSGR